METERRAFEAFLAMHAHKAEPTSEPVAHLHFLRDRANPSVPHDEPLLALTREDVLECDLLDKSSTLVQWLLEQMRTYACHRQRIVGLVFDSRTVLSEVLICASDLRIG